MNKLSLKYLFCIACSITTSQCFALDQWASQLINFSSQYTTTNWSAKQVLGAPNTTVYGDRTTSWAPSQANGGVEYVTVGYAVPVYATSVTVRETYGNGFVKRIDLIDTNNISHPGWTGVDNSPPNQINNFKVSWPRTTYLVKAVKVTLDTIKQSGWEEIDAIMLQGVETLSGKISPRLGSTAILVCKNSTTGQLLTSTINGATANAPVTQWDCQKAGLKFKVGDMVSIQITGKIAN